MLNVLKSNSKDTRVMSTGFGLVAEATTGSVLWNKVFIDLLMFVIIGKFSDAATRGVLYKKVFLKITQNSQENTCVWVSFLIKLQASGLQLYLK